MGIATAKFSESIYFANNNESREKNDFYFSIFVSGNPQKKDDKEQKYPKIYILGLERLFKNDESIDTTMDHFAKAFNTNGNNDWNISYGESPYGKCIIVTCVADNIKENLSATFQLSYRYEFTADFQDKDSIGVTVHFDDFNTIYSDIENRIEQNSIITAYEKPYIEDFTLQNSKGERVKGMFDGETGEISWAFGNVEKVSASLCDETGIEVANTSPYLVTINKDRTFKLFVEKNGYKISRTLFIKDAYYIKNIDDWNAFATSVKKGYTYTDKLVILDADITVSQKIGDSDANQFFSGTFDGNGHTITVNMTDDKKNGLALFQLIQGATIKNLTVAGTITGGIHAAGLVGYSFGPGSKIINCIVTATIKGGTHIGGILGHGNAIIENCVFKGLLIGGTVAKGVFLGWGREGYSKSVSNSLYIMQNNQEKQNLDLVQLNEGSVNVAGCYKTADIGAYGTLAYLTKPSDFSTIEKKAIDGTTFYVPGLPSGSGAKNDPYIISNEKDWNSFAKLVSRKDMDFAKTYEGEYVQLNADITVSQKIGDSDANQFFSGTFDGNGHTITVNMTDDKKNGLALFQLIQGATIKNLTVAGTITGGIHAAGLVGYSFGPGSKIINCIVTATIKGGTHIGGILGHGNAIIENCVFKGLLIGGTVAKGVFLGWGREGYSKSVSNSLYIMQNNQEKQNLDLVQLNEGSVNVAGCYKTADIGAYGTLAYLTKPSDFSTIEKKAIDGTTFYVPGLPSGRGIKNDPYIINDVNDWRSFAKLVSGKDMDFAKTYEGEYVRLNADITVSEKIGDTNDPKNRKFFSGTFNGNGHTINVTMTDKNQPGLALFHEIEGATITDLTVTGTIIGGIHSAGLVGYTFDLGGTITNCIVTAIVCSDESHIGGILGHGNAIIKNCVFKGSLIGKKTDDKTTMGVFLGWGYRASIPKSVKSCLYIMKDGQENDKLDLVQLNDGSVEVEDCYKTADIGKYGKLAYLTKPSGFSTIEKTAIDGTKYYVPV